MTPYDEDSVLSTAAAATGMRLDRFQQVEITDHKAIVAAGLTVLKPDYARIRKLLLDGAAVEGARLGEIEYRLVKRHEDPLGVSEEDLDRIYKGLMKEESF